MHAIRSLLNFLLAAVVTATPAFAAERSFTTNALDQVVAVTDSDRPALNATFTYDENGNRATKTQGGITTVYRWDARDRLIEVLQNGNWIAQYDYDASGLRIEKVVRGSPNSTSTRFQYDGTRLQSEANVLNNTLVTYYRAADGTLLGYVRSGEYRSVLLDDHGTPTAILSSQGAVLGRFVYDPWGGLLGSTGAESIPIRYTGYYFDDETGLYYANARYYDPTTGTFISRDPVDGDIESPITQHKYLAFNANPGLYQDPTGHCGLATGDASECINNVAAAEGWSTERWQDELAIQSAAEERSAPGKLIGMAATMTGLGLSRALGAGVQAYRQFRHFGYAAAVAANQGAPYGEQALELASGTPGTGTSTVPNLAALESRGARAAAAAELSDVPLPSVASTTAAPIAVPYNGPMTVVEGGGLDIKLVPTRPSVANAMASAAAGRVLADSEVNALRGAGLTDGEISRHMELAGDIRIFRGTSEGYPGNPGLQVTQTTPVSFDPVVATIFALESRVYGGKPVLQFGDSAAFGESILLGNGAVARRMSEREGSLGIAPLEFAARAPQTASIDQVRAVLGQMGYNLPATINGTNQATNLLDSVPRMTPDQVQEFMTRMKNQ